MVLRIRYKKCGGHYHCRVFSASGVGMTFAKNGELVFDDKEWPDVLTLTSRSSTRLLVEIMEEEQ